MPRAVRFETHADDIERAIGDRRAVLGRRLAKWTAVAGVPWLAAGKESEGGIFGVEEADKNAR
jgi:hypothetical protein